MSDIEVKKPKVERTKLLKVICWLSSMFGFFNVLTNLFSIDDDPEVAIGQGIGAQIENLPNFESEIVEYFTYYVESYVQHNLSLAVLYIMGLFGVYQMYMLKKRGFFMYGLAHIFISFYPVMMVHSNDYSLLLSAQFFAVTVIFVVLYGTQLKHMK